MVRNTSAQVIDVDAHSQVSIRSSSNGEPVGVQIRGCFRSGCFRPPVVWFTCPTCSRLGHRSRILLCRSCTVEWVCPACNHRGTGSDFEENSGAVFSLTDSSSHLVSSDASLVPRARICLLAEAWKPKDVTNEFCVGRHPQCDFVVDDIHVSNHHFRITDASGGGFNIEQLSQRNALFVNSVLLRRGDSQSLQDGDHIWWVARDERQQERVDHKPYMAFRFSTGCDPDARYPRLLKLTKPSWKFDVQENGLEIRSCGNARTFSAGDPVGSDVHLRVILARGQLTVEQVSAVGCHVNECFIAQGRSQDIAHGDYITLCKEVGKFRPRHIFFVDFPSSLATRADAGAASLRVVPTPNRANTPNFVYRPPSLTQTVLETAQWSPDTSVYMPMLSQDSSSAALMPSTTHLADSQRGRHQISRGTATSTELESTGTSFQGANREAVTFTPVEDVETLPLPGAACAPTQIDGPSQSDDTSVFHDFQSIACRRFGRGREVRTTPQFGTSEQNCPETMPPLHTPKDECDSSGFKLTTPLKRSSVDVELTTPLKRSSVDVEEEEGDGIQKLASRRRTSEGSLSTLSNSITWSRSFSSDVESKAGDTLA